MSEMLSSCCDAPDRINGPHLTAGIWLGVCSKCREHADFYDPDAEEEREFSPEQKAFIANGVAFICDTSFGGE